MRAISKSCRWSAARQTRDGISRRVLTGWAGGRLFEHVQRSAAGPAVLDAGGWPELALLLSFQLLCHSIGAAISFVQFATSGIARLGTDTLLVKPMSPGPMVFSELTRLCGPCGAGHSADGWTLTQVGIDWTAFHVIYLVLSIVSAGSNAALMTLLAPTRDLLRSRHLYRSISAFGVDALPAQHLSRDHPGAGDDRAAAGFTAFVPVFGKPILIEGRAVGAGGGHPGAIGDGALALCGTKYQAGDASFQHAGRLERRHLNVGSSARGWRGRA